jgi:hypothetical protein
LRGAEALLGRAERFFDGICVFPAYWWFVAPHCQSEATGRANKRSPNGTVSLPA